MPLRGMRIECRVVVEVEQAGAVSLQGRSHEIAVLIKMATSLPLPVGLSSSQAGKVRQMVALGVGLAGDGPDCFSAGRPEPVWSGSRQIVAARVALAVPIVASIAPRRR